MSTVDGTENGFFTFYREYAHTGIHAVTTAGLTAFGLLTFVHQGFVVLAIAVYVLPPIYLYLTRDGEAPEPIGTGSENEVSASEPADTEAADSEPTVVGGESTGSTESATTETASSGSEHGDGDNRDVTESQTTGKRKQTPPAGLDDATGFSDTETDDRAGEADERDVDDQPDETDAAEVDTAVTGEWTEIDSPTQETLFDVVAVGEHAYAAGENGVLLARDDGWEPLLDHGPAAESETLRGVDVTADGNAVWVAGDGGALGRYDTETGRHTDHSAPDGITDNWTDLAVAGATGEEHVSLVNGSGQVLFGEYGGSAVEWDEPVKPGSGSSMSAIEFTDESTGYCCDTNSGVYEISGREFERIGIEDGGSFTALAATDETIGVTDDDGTVQRFDGAIWTPLRAAESALLAIDTDDGEWIAVGAGGTIREQRGDGWESVASPTTTDLNGIAIDATAVAVGETGLVLERS